MLLQSPNRWQIQGCATAHVVVHLPRNTEKTIDLSSTYRICPTVSYIRDYKISNRLIDIIKTICNLTPKFSIKKSLALKPITLLNNSKSISYIKNVGDHFLFRQK